MKNQGRSSRIEFSLYLITDRRGCAGRDLSSVVEQALQGGVKAVQLREKDLPGRELYVMAMEMRELTRRYGATLFINDRIDIAMAVEADGVHLGEWSIPTDAARKIIGGRKLIGVSCHSLQDAFAARYGGADFITCGPVFFTPSKAAYGEPLGLSVLQDVVRQVDIPVLAIGGINRYNAREVVSSGAGGIALISAILAADDPREEAGKLLSLLDQAEE